VNHRMGPVALVELGGPDRSPNPLRDRRYLELLLPAGGRVAHYLWLATRRRPPRSLPARVAEIESSPRSRPAPEGRCGSPAAVPQQTFRSQPARAAAKFSRNFRPGGGGVCRRPPAADQPHASLTRISVGFLETRWRPTAFPRVLPWLPASHSIASRWKDTLGLFRVWGVAVGHPHGSFPRVARKLRPGASKLLRVFEPPTTVASARGGPSCDPGWLLAETPGADLRAPPQVLRRGVGRPELLRPRPRPRSGHRVCAAQISPRFFPGRGAEVNLRAHITAL
jgi:hypothetical protein